MIDLDRVLERMHFDAARELQIACTEQRVKVGGVVQKAAKGEKKESGLRLKPNSSNCIFLLHGA